MKKLIIIIAFSAVATVSVAQDTAFISRNKTTALFFKTAVRIIGRVPPEFLVQHKEDSLVTIKAVKPGFSPSWLDVQEIETARIYHIPVEYSYGRAGRRIEIVEKTSVKPASVKTPEVKYSSIANVLASGKRKNVVDHVKAGRLKAWVDKLSLAAGKLFLRLDIRNRSNLPYDIDFVRFYIRDLKTVTRMATHEQEILPLYATLAKRTSVVNKQEVTSIFCFQRFSLSEDQALNVELYERNGNRHLYMQIKQKDLENLKIINPAPQQPADSLVAADNIN